MVVMGYETGLAEVINNDGFIDILYELCILFYKFSFKYPCIAVHPFLSFSFFYYFFSSKKA